MSDAITAADSAHHHSSRRWRAIRHAAISSVGAKGLSIGCTLLQIPIALKHLGTEAFGLWMTITGLFAAMTFTDLGLGFGIQNRIAEAFGKDDPALAKRTYFTGVAMLAGIGLLMASVGSTILAFFDWGHIFKISNAVLKGEATTAVQASCLMIYLGLPLTSAQRLANGYQLGWMLNVWLAVGSVASLVLIGGAAWLNLGFIPFLICALLPPILANFGLWLQLMVRLRWFGNGGALWDASCVRPLLFTGIRFVPPQITVVILNAAPVLIVSAVLGATALTPLNLTQRLLGFVAQLQLLVLTPLWPAYREAITRGDHLWVTLTFRKSLRLTAALLVPVALLGVFGRQVIAVWTHGGAGSLPTRQLVLLVSLWWGVTAAVQPCTFLLNAMDKLKGQSTGGIISCLTALGLLPFFCKRFGVDGVPLALLISYLPCAFPWIWWECLSELKKLGRSAAPHAPATQERVVSH